MKTLQAGLQFLRSQFMQRQPPRVLKKPPRRRYRSPNPVPRMAINAPPQPMKSPSQPSLSFELQSSVRMLQQRTRDGWKRLEYQASHINRLSTELEAALLELKAIASQVNTDWKTLQKVQHSSTQAIIPNVCEYQITKLPLVQYKPSGAFLLTSRSVDLFKAERDAIVLAQVLRRRTRRKRLKR
ncbi:MAG: hypothetical protein RLP02_07465 [Coleofasciculus sp. C2-GNP5-27]